MHTRTKTAGLLAATLASAIVTTGCAHHNATRAGKPAASASAAAGLPAGVLNATAVPTAVPNNTATRKNVNISTCQATKEGWQATGTANNPGDKQTEYTVTVFFTTSTGTVIGTGQTTVGVKPRDQQPWNVTATFHPAHDTRCVLRGVG